jgi:hypothetical protein
MTKVFETPTREAFAKLSLEPDFMKRVTNNHTETRAVTSAMRHAFFAKFKKQAYNCHQFVLAYLLS